MSGLSTKIRHITDKEFVRFILAGVSNPLVSYIAYLIFLWMTKGNYIFANLMGFVFGTLNAYILNSKFVFKKRNRSDFNPKYFIKTFVSYGLTWILNTGLLCLIVERVKIPKIVAPLINAVFIFFINFILNKFWVFNDRKGGEEKNEF